MFFARSAQCGPLVALLRASRNTSANLTATMLYGFINRVSLAHNMRLSLDEASQRVRAIAQRVSQASANGENGFALPGAANDANAAIDLEAEMTALADEQLRYETTAKLLERTYQKIRLSIRER
jgi:flagellar basal body rod protein FlgB